MRADRPGGSGGPRAPRLLVAAVLALLAAALVACGSDDDEGSNGGNGGGPPLTPNIVTNEDVDAQQEGSPERGLLEWWQAFQFQDVAAVESLTSEETLDDIGDKQLRKLVEARGKGLQGLEVLGSSESGDTASVRAGLLTFQPEEGEPPPDEPTSSTPATFELVNEGDEWLFNDTAFLEPMIESLEAAEEQAEQAADEEQQNDGN
jgi:hypothetical protein